MGISSSGGGGGEGEFAPLLKRLHCPGKQTGGHKSCFPSKNDVSIHINTAANHFRAFSG